jgi:hypothetical protein
MAKVTGLGSFVSVADSGGTARTITNDITNYAFTTPRGTQDVTGLDKFAHETLLLLCDFTVTFNGVFDYTANLSHAVFSTVTSTSVFRATVIQVTNTGTTPQLLTNTFYTDYQITRANTGELTWQVPGQLADGTVPTWS